MQGRNMSLLTFLGILSLLLLSSKTAVASYEQPECDDKETSSVFYHTHCYEDVDTDTDTNTQKGSELGVGTDVVVWQKSEESQNMLEEVVAEYRYDAHNSDHAGYLVARVNLWKKVKGFFGW